MNSIVISDVQQEEVSDFLDGNGTTGVDLIITSYGADSRSTFLLGELKRSAKLVLAGYSSFEEANNDAIDQFKKRHSAIVCSFEDIANRIIALAENKADKNDKEFSLIVDVSSMPRVHMGTIFSYIKEAAQILPVRLSIGYCLARYISPPDIKFPVIRRVAPVHSTFSGWGNSAALPIDAIVSLGYEQGKAIGAVEYLEPRNRWVFVPNSPEERFLKQVKSHNRSLIDSAADAIIDYDVLRPADTYFTLLSLVVGLAREARPVLLPFGPKLFFALSLVVAMRVQKASVWYVDGDDESPRSTSPEATQHAVVFSCTLTSEDSRYST